MSSPSRPQTEGGGSARSRSEMTRRLERALVFHDVILVVEEGTFYLSNNVAARSRHLLGGAVVLSARRFPEEVELVGSDHVIDVRYAVKHPPHMFISYSFLCTLICHPKDK